MVDRATEREVRRQSGHTEASEIKRFDYRELGLTYVLCPFNPDNISY